MIQLYQWFTLLHLQTAVTCDTASMEVYFNNSFCYANVNFFVNNKTLNIVNRFLKNAMKLRFDKSFD